MTKIKFTCNVITPMFMAGADGRTPELRPSEFKGMMRFWWRAVMAEDDVERLKEMEASIFGGTGENEVKSKVSLKISYDSGKLEKSIVENLKNEYELRWNYNREKNVIEGKDAGISYLLYSTVLPRRERPFIKDDFEFCIAISSFDRDALKKAVASFWLAAYLGGFGTRARRGGGNISIEKVEGDTFTIDFIPRNLSAKTALKNWLEENIKKIKEVIPMGNTKRYSNLKNAKILIFDPKNNWRDALNEIGTEFKNFRQRHKSDVWKTPAFGMPVMHNRFKERFVPYTNDRLSDPNTNDRLSDRRSSPLIFKVIKADEYYFPVIIRLSGDVVYGGKIGKEIKDRDDWILAEKPKKIDDSLIDEFLNSLKNKEEVALG